MKSLKEKEIQYSEANLGLSENVIYSKDVKQAVLKDNKLLSDLIYKLSDNLSIDNCIIDKLIQYKNNKTKIFGDWEK